MSPAPPAIGAVVAGNGGGVVADGPAKDGLPSSAAITIPANAVLFFAQQ
jgi:hypothetical protein